VILAASRLLLSPYPRRSTANTVFSAPGFEEFMRAESVREGEKSIPLTKAEDAAILAKHAHAVIYKEP